MKQRLLSLTVALGVLAGAIAPALAEPASAPAAKDPRFGIAEGFRNTAAMAEIGAGWERLVFSWTDVQPNGPNDFSRLGLTLPTATLDAELGRGIKVAGLLQFTPGWAARDPRFGQRSVPRNLDLPFDDPNNYFGRYVYETVKFYTGKINEWIIWNEPEFRETDAGAGGSFTWKGTDNEFAQLMKVGYLAAKKANPNAVVSFPGTSYWVEELSSPKRPQFYERLLAILTSDPSAAANNYYHDVVSLNLYRSPDDVYRVQRAFKEIQKKYGVDKPVWLTETNAMPTNDSSIPCAAKQASTFPRTTMDQQAAYAIQTFAMAAAADYARIGFYQMVDSDSCREPAVWGVTRDDGSRRPVAEALKVAIENMSGYTRASFVPLIRETERWPIWPQDATSYIPNWQVYQVALDKPGNRRVSVLWNGDGQNLTVRVRKNGTAARVVNRVGQSTPLQENQGWWVLDLPAATARGEVMVGGVRYSDPEGYYFIGGDPLVLVEEGVAPQAPVIAPRLGQPGSVAREFRLFASPADQTVGLGQPAEFFLSTRGYEDFNEPISFRIAAWSSQRFPEVKDGSTFPIEATFSSPTVNPGDRAALRLNTATAAEPGIYYVTVEGSAGGMTRTVDLALVLN